MCAYQELKHISKLHGGYTDKYLRKFKTCLIIIDNVRTEQPRGILHDLEPPIHYSGGVVVQYLCGRR